MKTPMKNELDAPLPIKFLTAGTAACIADFATFPFDTAKVRLQIQGEGAAVKLVSNGLISAQSVQYRGLVGTISTIMRQEGTRALYNGLSAGLQRQMCFASIRIGLYDGTKSFYQKLLNESPDGLNVITRIMAGLTTGGFAVICAQPTDVVKVRFQAQNRNNNNNRYKSTMQAYRMIGREEGVRGLWKGAVPNIFRNSIVNVSEIVCYDIVKDCLMKYLMMKDNIQCHFSAAVIAGFATTVVASPIDVVKTRYMNSPKGIYTGAIDCTIRMARKEGPAAFYKGFVPSFARISLWNVALWITYEQFKQLFYKPTPVYVINE